ncbi:hypothetical protein ATCC90586_005500 [Pythium insidiosum]|nr:hypothetical protein ATCC90586_005500 [Pythium insidiosum]
MLLKRFKDDPAMTQFVPTVRQLENRKSYIARKAKAGWDLKDYATFVHQFIPWAYMFVRSKSTPRFDDNDMRDYGVEDLVHGARRAYLLGVNVSG